MVVFSTMYKSVSFFFFAYVSLAADMMDTDTLTILQLTITICEHIYVVGKMVMF